MNEKILKFENDAEYEEWLNNKPGLLELIKSAHDKDNILIIQIGENIYRRIIPQK